MGATVVPEYNHSFPGLLKHVLTELKEYIHKAVGVCGVSAGPFGGARMIQSCFRCCANSDWSQFFRTFTLAPQESFSTRPLAKSPIRPWWSRVAKFLDELVWMSRALRDGC